MTKLGAVAVTGMGAGILINNVLHQAIVSNPTIPTWVSIVALLGVPVLTLIGVIFNFFHIGAKVKEVKAQTVFMEAKFDGKMDELLRLAKQQAEAEGALRGHAEAISEAKALSDQHLIEEGLRKQGADDLLAAQQTPPAASPSDSSHADHP